MPVLRGEIMTTEDMQADHLALAFECNRQLRAENEALKERADYYERTNAAQAELLNNAIAAGDVLRKDAERYRWLRKKARTDTGEPWIARSFLSGISAWTGEYADAAIDAAMQTIPCTDKP